MMLLKKQDLQLIKVEKREGISKQGKPYLFYVGKFIDGDGDTAQLKFVNEVVADSKLVAKLMTAHNVPVSVDISIYSSGFNLKGSIVSIDL